MTPNDKAHLQPPDKNCGNVDDAKNTETVDETKDGRLLGAAPLLGHSPDNPIILEPGQKIMVYYDSEQHKSDLYNSMPLDHREVFQLVSRQSLKEYRPV